MAFFERNCTGTCSCAICHLMPPYVCTCIHDSLQMLQLLSNEPNVAADLSSSKLPTIELDTKSAVSSTEYIAVKCASTCSFHISEEHAFGFDEICVCIMKSFLGWWWQMFYSLVQHQPHLMSRHIFIEKIFFVQRQHCLRSEALMVTFLISFFWSWTCYDATNDGYRVKSCFYYLNKIFTYTCVYGRWRV